MQQTLTHDQELLDAVTTLYAEEALLDRDTRRPTSEDGPAGWSSVDKRFLFN